MTDYAMLFPLHDPEAERCAWCWGASVDAEADRLIEAYTRIGYPSARAGRYAKSVAMTLDDERIGFGGAHRTQDQKAGLKLQAAFWRAVYREIEAREMT